MIKASFLAEGGSALEEDDSEITGILWKGYCVFFFYGHIPLADFSGSSHLTTNFYHT